MHAIRRDVARVVGLEVGAIALVDGIVLQRPRRRDPDVIGYQNWVATLAANPNDYRHMIFGFIYSKEYRERFGQP